MPLKIAYIVAYDDGGVYNVAKPVADALTRMGHTCDLIVSDKGAGPDMAKLNRTFSDYDIMHCWSAAELHLFPDCAPPMVLSLHHIPLQAEGFYQRAAVRADHIHVSDYFCQRQLGRWGLTNVTRIPYALFPRFHWKDYPIPADFTVGYLGNPPGKRFEVIEEAAKMVGVPCRSLTYPPWHPLREVERFYRDISVYAVASFEDGGPLPPMEALMCGRPVISTPVGMMPQVVTGLNGVLYNGSVEGLAAALIKVKNDYGFYRRGALRTILPSPEDVVHDYVAMYEELL